MTQKKINPFRVARYLMGAAELSQLPPDEGVEVALAGRSNAGKSTALNAITEQKSLAKTSKTPGRTQLINLFRLDDQSRITDLPGYGFAKVAKNVKEQWQRTLSTYLQERLCLQALVIFMDIRHPLKETDKQMIQWAVQADLSVHVVLSKADKLKSGARKTALLNANKHLQRMSSNITSQVFSATNRIGVDELIDKLRLWYGYMDEEELLNLADTSSTK
ncbi:ribosome biogenesis GTP-binding protein YihA/YsxC [Aliikangiella sp. G2MR2-5]|uniref:ribosome biogenesis GTP-binding protein YihA/YsxC n=1 Tax=Aliikangiella sp. G2MR2-5 TaxID=2788943 RepID=UPI0018AAFB26|nr:ribosome biogenesis GTP-binding protein YihA/YsxC [Aliikangiella sp. G2MR2-5]